MAEPRPMVVIGPRTYMFEGVADPERAQFTVTLGDTGDTHKGPAEEVFRFVGAEAAIAWGRERAEVVLITLDGHWDLGTSFSAGEEPWFIAGIHDAPLPPWPGSGNIETPPGGWYESPDADTIARVEAEIRKLLESGPPLSPARRCSLHGRNVGLMIRSFVRNRLPRRGCRRRSSGRTMT